MLQPCLILNLIIFREYVCCLYLMNQALMRNGSSKQARAAEDQSSSQRSGPEI